MILLVIQGLSKRYRGSYLGVLWSLINPILTVAVFAFVFPLVLKIRMEDYLTYIFSGIAAWNLISTCVIGGCNSITQRKGLLRKIYLPKLIFPLVLVITELVNAILVLIAFHVIAFFLGLTIKTNIFYLTSSFICVFFFCVGVSGMLSVLCVYFRDIKHIVGVLMQGAFFLSAIIYPAYVIPEKFLTLLEFNPLYQFVRLFHQAIYYGSEPDWSYFTVPVILVGLLLIMSIALQQKFDKKLMYRI